MIVIDKASWYLDAGENKTDVIERFQIVFSFLHEHSILNQDGEEIYQLGVDSSVSLHSDLITTDGFSFLNLCYDKAISLNNNAIFAYLTGAYDMYQQLSMKDS